MACLSSRLRPEAALTPVVAWAPLILKLALQLQQFVWYHSWEWAAVNLELTNILRDILCLIDLSDLYSLLAGLLPGFLSVLKRLFGFHQWAKSSPSNLHGLLGVDLGPIPSSPIGNDDGKVQVPAFQPDGQGRPRSLCSGAVLYWACVLHRNQ